MHNIASGRPEFESYAR